MSDKKQRSNNPKDHQLGKISKTKTILWYQEILFSNFRKYAVKYF